MQAFSISPPLPSPPKGMEDGAPPHAAARDSTGKSGGKRGGGVGRGMENDLLPGKMIVEAAIDWESMQVKEPDFAPAETEIF